MKMILLTGRILFSLIFLFTLMSHFSAESIGYASANGVPLAGLAVPLSGIIAALGALSVISGYRAKLGAWLIIIFLLPVTFTLHNFWAFTDPVMKQMHMVMFMKNLSMIGAAMIITYFGSGPLSMGSISSEEIKSSRTPAEKPLTV